MFNPSWNLKFKRNVLPNNEEPKTYINRIDFRTNFDQI